MRKNLFPLLMLLSILAISILACGGQLTLTKNEVVVSIVYGSEKEEWLIDAIDQFHAEKPATASGRDIRIEAIPMGSIESIREIVEENIQPTVWSPASSVYIPVGNAMWREIHGEDLVVGNPKDLVLSPVVIAMWEPMARALGWPQESISWKDIAELAVSEEGWAEYGYPEWGQFKFGHTHPNYSNSGIVSIIAQAYAGAEKQRDLTLDDLSQESLIQFMADVESAIIHYGTSTGFFATRMFERGPSYLSAAVMYENLIVAQESKRLQGSTFQLPVAAIYPEEGTFFSNHPYCILNAHWVTEEQAEAAEIFQTFLLSRSQQINALEYGFRPADPSIPISSPIDAQHGVDPSQPMTVLEVPTAEVIIGIQDLWKEVKKPVDLVIVMDTSGSMAGQKISAARASLIEFINKLDDRDRIEVILFSHDLIHLNELAPVGEVRADLTTRVAGITEGGDTRLYDAASLAYDRLEDYGNPNHIRAVVILSDGQDTYSNISIDDLLVEIGPAGEEAGSAIKLFTIGFGNDADLTTLKIIAEITGGRQYESTPETINEIYAQIATFF